MEIFQENDYRQILRAKVEALPNKGRGQWQKLATNLAVHPSLVSQVLRGDKELSPEQACGVIDFLGLRNLEGEYFLGLVELARAGSEPLRRRLRQRLEKMRAKATKVQANLEPSRKVRAESRAQFYSSWIYSALRLATSLPGSHSVQSLAEQFNLPRKQVQSAVDFLVSEGLCTLEGNSIRIGPARTHIAADDPLVARHHMNWRLKAIEKHSRLADEELAFTGPLSIAAKNFPEARKVLLSAIQQVSALVEKDDPTLVACLNVDLFKI